MLKQKEIIEASKQQMEQTGSFVEAPAKPEPRIKTVYLRLLAGFTTLILDL